MNEGRIVNFLAVDFWSLSELPAITQAYNAALAKSNRRLLRTVE